MSIKSFFIYDQYCTVPTIIKIGFQIKIVYIDGNVQASAPAQTV